MMTPADGVDVNLYDLKARKGHLCQGGLWGDGENPVCGCGARLRELADFMSLSPDRQRAVRGAPADPHGAAAAELGWAPVEDPPDEPPPLFRHANGEACYGCQSCFAEEMEAEVQRWAADVPDPALQDAHPSDIDDGHSDPPGADLMAEAHRVEAPGREVIARHDAPDMSPAVPVIDPTMSYGPAEVERAILDANRRLELGSKHEANLIAATEQAKIEYELAYARAIERSPGGAADVRKANATLASEREYRAWHEAMAARDAMKAVTHSLRSTVSALQSVGRSVGVTYTGPQGRGR